MEYSVRVSHNQVTQCCIVTKCSLDRVRLALVHRADLFISYLGLGLFLLVFSQFSLSALLLAGVGMKEDGASS